MPLPVRIRRVDPPNLGSVHAQIVCKCDDGCDYVAKDGSVHPLIPHAEWVCTHLADLLNLPGLQCKVLEMHNGSRGVKRFFGSRWEEGEIPKTPAPWYMRVKQGSVPLKEVAPVLSRIYAFDHFIYNIDRHLNNFFARKSRQSIAILSVDYSKAWTYRGFPFPPLPFDLRDPEHTTVKAHRDLTKMWGRWFDLAAAEELLTALKEIKVGKIKEIIEQHPKEWLPLNKKRIILKWWRSKERFDLIDRIAMGLKNDQYF